MSEWRLTLFRDDDETPLVGTTSGGAVAEASCSTDPSHPRPFLMVPETLAESEVDLAEGSSVIGQVNVRVLDRRRDPADQATGWLTALLAVPAGEHGAGESALNGRRALLEQTDDGASWFVLMDGIVGGVQLDASLVAYTLEIRDIRERERKVRIFPYADTATVLPRGVLNGYGSYGTGWGSRWLVPPTRPMVGEYRSDGATQGRVDVYGMWRKKRVPLDLVVSPQVLETLKPESKRVGKRRLFLGGRIYRYENVYARVRLLWRYAGTGGAWTEIRAPMARQWGSQGLIRTRNGQLDISDDDRPVVTGVREVVLAAPSSALLPANRRRVEVIVAYNGPPSEQYPLHLDGMTAGELLKKLYDGEYSAEDDDPVTTLRIRYDEAAVLALRTPVRARITEPVNDLREWVQEHLYKPLGAAPALDPRGRISPIRYALPPADLPLTELDDGNTAAGAGWEHSAGDVVNHVIVRYKRDSRVPPEEDPKGERSAGDGLAEVETTVERINAPSLDALGDKPLELEMSLFRAVGGVEGDPIQGSVESETAFNLAMERADQALDRFVYGAQRVSARCMRTATAHLRVGDWVLVSLSWLPDYRTGVRGGTRLAQVVALKDLDPAWRELTLLDAGPENQVHSVAPTLGTPAPSGEVDGVVLVPVTGIPAGAEARVEYAVADSRPAADAGSWMPLERTSVPGTVVETPPLPAGTRVWIRARTESPGVRPSAYTDAVSVELPQAARLGEVKLDVDPATGDAVVTWIPNAFARGARLVWGQHHPAAEPVLSARADVDAAAAGATLPIPALFGRTLTVEVEPWTGWTGASVSGTPGPRQRVSWHLRAADSGKVRATVEIVDDGTTGTLTLGLADPEELVAGVAFWVTDGAGNRTGPHPADRTPAPGVHQRDVALHPEHNVVIEPVVTLYDGSEIRPGGETFDRDRSANLVGRPQVSYDGQSATVAATGDSDTVSLHAEERVDGAWVALAALAPLGRRGSLTVLASTAGKRRLRVFGRNAAGQDGPAEEVEIDRYQIRSPAAAKFWATVDPHTNRADLHLRVDGPAAVFPVTAQVYARDPADDPMYLSPVSGVWRHVFGAPGQEIGPGTYPDALAGIELPRTGSARWWVKLTDAQGNPAAWAFTSADRDRLPGGEVTPNDYSGTPSLVCTYDDDVAEVVVVVPGGKRRTFTDLSGGGAVTYTVSADTLDDGTRENPFRVSEGAGRGTYRVEYRGGGRTEVLFSGPLHGVAAQPPVCEPTVAMDMTLRDRADVSVRVSSPVGEPVGVEMKDSDAPGAPVWRWVAAPGSQTPAYAASGSTVGPEAEFATEGLPGARKFNDLLLARDQVRKLYVRAVGEHSGVAGSWTPVVLEGREQPWLASVALTFDEGTDELVFTVVGGAFCRSAELAVSDDPDFGANVRTVAPLLAEGAAYAHRFAIAAAERNRPWYGRGIPFNGPGAAGLSGEPAQASAFVAASDQGVLPPTVTLAVRYTNLQATVTVTAALGAGGRGPLQWRHRTDDDYEGGGAWGPGAGEGWAAFTSPRSVAVPRGNDGGKWLFVQVRDADGRVAEDSLPILPFFPGLGPGGRLNPRMPYADLLHTPYDALEGRWMVDTFYYDDAVLRPDVAIHDTGHGARGITDVARRAIGGLSAYDPAANSGGEIARNAPLARIAPALPDVSGSDGRVVTLGGRTALMVSRAQHGVFLETFENGASDVAGWNLRAGARPSTAVAEGRAGGKALRASGYAWMAFPQNIPFDPSKLYRIRARVRLVTDPTAGGKVIYLGVEGVAADGVTLVNVGGTASFENQHYVAATGYPSLVAGAGWTEFTGFFKGWGTPVPAPTSAANPSPLHPSVRYIRPQFILNFLGGNGTTDIDYIAIDVLDEDLAERGYRTIKPGGAAILKGVTADDPGGVARDLGDAGRRAIGGLDASSYSVSQNVPLARLAPTLPDISAADGRVATIAGTAVATVRDEARVGHQGVGLDPQNLIVNGGGQMGTTGWTLGAGNALTSATDAAKHGDRSLKLHNATAAISYSYQDVACTAGDVFEVSAWIKTTALPAADPGMGVFINLNNATAGLDVTGTLLERQAPAQAGLVDVGLPADGVARDWTFVRTLFRVDFTGTLRMYLDFGYNGTQSGTVWFDGIQVVRRTGYELEGRRRVDTLYDADGRLGTAVTVQDAGYASRTLLDVARRAQGGLNAFDPAGAGTGGEIARNAPLARIAAVLPGIDPGSGRINRSAAASDGSTLETTAGSADQANRLRNLVNNPSQSGTLDRWTNPGGMDLVQGAGAPFAPGQSFWVHRLYSSASEGKITFSDWFEVDPDKAYEVTWYQAASVLSGADYFGVHTRDAAGGDPGITEIDLGGTVQHWTNTNPYWWWGQNGTDRYYKHTGYILPAGAPLEWAVGLGENVARVFRFNPTTKRVQLRYLNWYPSVAKYLYTGHVRVVELSPEALEARRRMDTFYDADGRLRGGVTVQDAGYTSRGLLDVARRAQGGLTAHDPASGTGGEIARNAPLARIAAVLPDINAADGRVATLAGTAASTVRDLAAGGYRKADFVTPYGDGYLRESLQILDPGVTWRDLTDVGRRTQVGLTWADTAGNGAEIARNAPLARIASVLPNVDPGTGRIYSTSVLDTRTANTPPSGYPMGVHNEFKQRDALGAQGGAVYGHLTTYMPWPNSSGGYATQTFASSDGVFKREGPAGGASWGPWREDPYEGRRRVDTLYEGDRRLKASVLQFDGAREVKLAQFAQYGTTQDGNAVAFSPPFQNVPVVQFGPGQVTYDPALGAVRQRTVAEAVGLTPSGFTARLKVRQADTVLSTNTLSPSGGVAVKYTATEAYDDVYVFNYSVTVYSYQEYYGPYEPYNPYVDTR